MLSFHLYRLFMNVLLTMMFLVMSHLISDVAVFVVILQSLTKFLFVGDSASVTFPDREFLKVWFVCRIKVRILKCPPSHCGL